LKIEAREGSLVNATYPSAVVAGNVETSNRIADTILAALSGFAPERIPAQGQGTMNNVIIGDPGWTYYETIGGGQGAGADGPGPSGVHIGMSNTLNTPIEALELEYPMRIERYELRYDSGGAGDNRGGDGIVRSVRHPPQGMEGGEPGEVGRNLLNGEELPPKVSREMEEGDMVTVETPGGGGYRHASDGS
jgi:N-methylhydantoinase B